VFHLFQSSKSKVQSSEANFKDQISKFKEQSSEANIKVQKKVQRAKSSSGLISSGLFIPSLNFAL
jgi:hypothetical protein